MDEIPSDMLRWEGNPQSVAHNVYVMGAGENYFATLGIAILRGRDFEINDRGRIPMPVIVNRTLARDIFAGQDPVGHHLMLGRDKQIVVEIVGVASDFKIRTLGETNAPALFKPDFNAQLPVRVAGNPTLWVEPLRNALGKADGTAALDVRPPCLSVAHRERSARSPGVLRRNRVGFLGAPSPPGARPLPPLRPARSGPYHLSGLQDLPFDGRVLGFAVGLGMLTTLLFGLLPAFRSTKIRLAEAIKVGETAVVGGRGSLHVLSIIAAAQIATILVLSTGAGLMMQSFWKMRYTNLGFQPDRLVVATLNLSAPAYREKARQSEFIQELLERTQSLPGVELVGVTRAGELPPGDFHATNSFAIKGRDQPLGGPRPIARYPVVSPAYFGIMGIPLLQGRLLQDSDGENAPPVVIVNRALVRSYFDHENPIGKRVRTGPDNQAWRTIAGVVGDVKTSGLTFAAEPAVYLPYRQAGDLTNLGLVMRSPLEAGIIAIGLRKTVASLDPNQAVANVQAMGDRLSESVSSPRFTTVLLFAFAGLAVVLGLIGVYGVMGCRIRWQLRELAVRQALGAQQKDVIWHVLRQALGIILPGLFAGLLGAIWLSRLLSKMLYEVSVHDPLTVAAVSTGLVSVALLACCIPAVRVARSDLVQSLRHD